jgi:DNA (cytosine-5)-methyltransferase 1
MEPFKLLDLFSGIGGFSLGLERTGGFKTVAFCEIDPFCRKLLAERWPEIPCYDDIRSLIYGDASAVIKLRPNVVCGGFPCQDISGAGHRVGIDGERSGLWSFMLAAVCGVRPDWFIVENVRDLLVRGIDRVLGDLASIGYDAWWDCVRASQLGYPHARDRLILVAYPAALRREEGERSAQEWRRLIRARVHGVPSAWARTANDDQIRSGFIRIVDGIPNRVDRLGALGNAVIPEIFEIVGNAILSAHRAHSAQEAA